MILKTMKWSKQQETEFNLYFCKKGNSGFRSNKDRELLLFRIAYTETPHFSSMSDAKSTAEEQWRWGNSPLRASKNYAQF